MGTKQASREAPGRARSFVWQQGRELVQKDKLGGAALSLAVAAVDVARAVGGAQAYEVARSILEGDTNERAVIGGYVTSSGVFDLALMAIGLEGAVRDGWRPTHRITFKDGRRELVALGHKGTLRRYYEADAKHPKLELSGGEVIEARKRSGAAIAPLYPDEDWQAEAWAGVRLAVARVIERRGPRLAVVATA